MIRPLIAAIACLACCGTAAAKDVPDDCDDLLAPKTPPADLVIASKCTVPAASAKLYHFKAVNILDHGELIFTDANGSIDFWATAIVVEKGGKLTIGTPATPIGTQNAKTTVTITLYGPPQAPGAKGVPCKSHPDESCGAPLDIWGANIDGNHNPKPRADVKKVKDLDTANKALYPGPPDDYFYAYHGMPHGDHDTYFGNKVLAVSYGGSLQLFGRKGAIYAADTSCKPTAADSTGRSWVRLKKTALAGADSITVEKPACGLGWTQGDQVVVTTTDYLPGHSEQREISGNPTDNGDGSVTIKLTATLAYHHNGERFFLGGLSGDESARLKRLNLQLGLTSEATGAETRAAVGLLSRNIRIVSGGCVAGEAFPAPGKSCSAPSTRPTEDAYFGGHTVFRQGYSTVQIQGVEFHQMGQGGRLSHYPVHFHHARKTRNPAKPELDSFVVDSSIWDSMTRWIVLHGTHDVTLARNVGYKSIGHGFYLEDGTEINNKLLGNLGVFARGAVSNDQNDRKVPGILAAPDTIINDAEFFPGKSDVDHPTVFWIMNGWNDFQFNMAAGAGTCGACYWLVSGANSGMSRDMKWESYASMQSINPDRAGTTPLKSFVGNYCTAAMTSFQTVTATEGCKGVAPANFYGPAQETLPPITNPLAPSHNDVNYYPAVHKSGGRFATRCGGPNHDPNADCSTAQLQPTCASGSEKDCMVTVLDRYTTSFNWAAFNFAAMWLRPQWYLVTDSVITDVQQAGLTMVTGGGYSASDVITGHWALTRKSIFVGHTQSEVQTKVPSSAPERTIPMPANAFAANGGPFNPVSQLRCAQRTDGNRPGDFCLSVKDGISFQIGNAFAVYQRLFSVYDGPAFQDSNAYLNIKSRQIDDCKPLSRKGTDSICDPPDKSVSRGSAWWAGFGPQGLRRGIRDPNDENKDFCYMPNAAIGWKQPNGFYYPPAFHSTNLFFKDVDTRHFVVTPLFKPGTLDTDASAAGLEYCTFNNGLFNGFTSIDRQTVLNDNDGSLTGYKNTIAVNLDPFFAAPVEALQCASDDTSKTSPYSYVTTVVYPGCAVTGTCAIPATDPISGNRLPNPHTGDWDQACSNENCYGIPLARLDLAKSDKGVPESVRMMGQATGQRSSLTVNHGTYYLDTTVPKAEQMVFVNKTVNPYRKDTCSDVTPASQECNISVFKGGGVYYVFMIYAKPDTEVKYRFYVGPGKTNDPVTELQLKLVQADIAPNPVKFTDGVAMKADRVKWFNNNKEAGVVEVTLAASDLEGFADKMRAVRKKHCQPASYCAWDDSVTDSLKACKQCTQLDSAGNCTSLGSTDVCGWAVADPHCAEGGCVGIKFTMPSGFQSGTKIDVASLASDLMCSNAQFNVPLVKVGAGVCPAEAPPVDDRMELNFANVTPANCQESTTGTFPRCSCPAR